MRKVLVGIVVAVSAIGLVGCSGTAEAVRANTEIVNYNNKPLECITWNGSHGETGMECNFAAYHDGTTSNEHGKEILDKEPREVVEVNYNGTLIPCITWNGSHGETGLSCDFAAL